MTTGPPGDSPKRELLTRYIPSRRKGHPSDLCGLLVYLASDACDFVTGQMLFVDGGAYVPRVTMLCGHMPPT